MPDGSGIAFLGGGNVWFASLASDSEPSALFHVRGSPGTLRWSPDARRLAFIRTPASTELPLCKPVREAHLDGWRSPVLVIHGDDDRNVRFVETVAPVEALRERGIHVEQLVFPDEVHGFLLHENRLAAYRASAGFLEWKPNGGG